MLGVTGREAHGGSVRVAIAPEGARGYNPAFDVTPAELIAAFITEKGVIRPPYAGALKARLQGG